MYHYFQPNQAKYVECYLYVSKIGPFTCLSLTKIGKGVDENWAYYLEI